MRGHLTEFGLVVPKGAVNAARLIAIAEDPESDVPVEAAATFQDLVDALTDVSERIAKLDAEIAASGRKRMRWREA